jgi:hypothetical protein
MSFLDVVSAGRAKGADLVTYKNLADHVDETAAEAIRAAILRKQAAVEGAK